MDNKTQILFSENKCLALIFPPSAYFASHRFRTMSRSFFFLLSQTFQFRRISPCLIPSNKFSTLRKKPICDDDLISLEFVSILILYIIWWQIYVMNCLNLCVHLNTFSSTNFDSFSWSHIFNTTIIQKSSIESRISLIDEIPEALFA